MSLREAGNTEHEHPGDDDARQPGEPHRRSAGERLHAIHDSSAAAKATMASMKSVMPTDFPSLGAPWLISGLAGLFGRSKLANRMPPITNVAISNVPGPQFPLYLAGAKMLTYYPVSIAIHSVALNITVQSYNGSLDFGLTACRKAMPDLSRLARLHAGGARGAAGALARRGASRQRSRAPPARPVPVAKADGGRARRPARQGRPRRHAVKRARTASRAADHRADDHRPPPQQLALAARAVAARGARPALRDRALPARSQDDAGARSLRKVHPLGKSPGRSPTAT